MIFRSSLFLFLPTIFLPLSSQPLLVAAKSDDELPPGLAATYTPGLGGRSVVRLDPDIQFNWDDASPDPRVPADRFEVQWRGKLFVPASGRYRFHFFLSGTARLAVAGKVAVAGSRATPQWLSGEPIELEQGHHAIEASFGKTTKDARVGLYWESSRFPLEPITARWFFHERPAGGDDQSNTFEHGNELVRAYRCAACHEIPGETMERPAASLEKLAGRINSAWLVRWLENPHPTGGQSRMPSFGLSAADARAVAAFLLRSDKKPDAPAKPAVDKGKPEAGESLVQSLGCLACHTLGGHGTANIFGGGPLDRVAEKRPAGFFREWLTKPQASNSAHHMPTFTLSKDEIDGLASFLARRSGPSEPAGDAPDNGLQTGDDEINRGKTLVMDHRCAACHEIPGVAKPGIVGDPLYGNRPRQRPIAWLQSCLDATETTKPRPRFSFDEDDRRAIVAFIEQLPSKVAPQSGFELGRRLMRELNCTSCHPRDLARGLEQSIIGRAAADAEATELAKLRGELEPPSLTSVGDKFLDATLAKLTIGGLAPRRPWLKVRMPRFEHRDAERDAIVNSLVEHDRIPSNPPSSILDPHFASALDPTTALTAGHQLISSRGFGCMSCHTVGKHQPKNIAVNARGSDLLKIGDRVRHEWFLRWTRDPARIVPGMEMPSITVPVRGILNDKLDLQIESLWQALNSPSFVVPSDRDTAQQIISLKPGDAPAVLRDVMYDCPPGSGWCARPFAIGLPNRQNILFDLDTMSLRGWWVGDFARERTEGKTWLWEPAGLPVWERISQVPTLALRDKDSLEIVPLDDSHAKPELAQWHTDGEAIVIEYHWRLGEETISVTERVRVEDTVTRSGFRRELSVKKLKSKRLEPVVVLPADGSELSQTWLTRIGPLGRTWVAAGAGRWTLEPVRVADGKPLACFCLAPRYKRTAHELVGYEFGWSYGLERHDDAPAAPTHAAAPAGPPAIERRLESLPVAPGFDVKRLPLATHVMPTAIAFHDQTPVVSSLKGQVSFARDTDGDGVEDSWQVVSDHLAAPFGLASGRHGEVIVSHKPELLLLENFGAEGHARRSQVIGAGWGVTEDYHDWTTGVVRDDDGNLIIGTGSDYTHKDRPKEARKWRGRILRVSPDGKIEELARGARYPTGLAMNRDGAIFFTDNQGVQNTFNEINHVIPGSRYGVPALDDPPADKDPWPERAPAIKIPHPWTRSVNGICFLDGPTDETRDAVRDKWGSFAGHGIGCEYDTRGLIRFSLQKIGDTYQGACYPFTLPEEQVPQDQRLLGPICCAVSPNGDLYVGGIRDSGWGGGNNVGELVRIKPSQNVPLGIREVRAWREGFVIDFTGPIDADAAADASKYTISSYHRIWKGTYATPDSDRRTEKILRAEVAADRRSVVLTLDGMRPGFVYDFHFATLGSNSQALWPAEAYYTLNQVSDDESPKR